MCIGWSFTSEPESSEARVSPTPHVLHMFMYMNFLRVVPWDCSVYLWSHAFLTYDDGSDESSPFATMQDLQERISTYIVFIGFFNIHLWRFFKPSSFCRSLIISSLSNNNISGDGVCALVGALLMNQNVQKLKLEWVQTFLFYELRGVHTEIV